MSEIQELHLDEFDVAPWDDVQEEAAPIEELEIYRKAQNFKKLKLISGASIDAPIDVFVRQNYGTEGVTRLKLARFLLKSLNLIPSDDVLLMMSCTKRARAVVATAGAGKTTTLLLDILCSKMLDKIQHCYNIDPVTIPETEVQVPAILYLNYNKHNVRPIEQRYQTLCARVNKMIEEQIDDLIESSTVHAFCHKWLRAFSFDVNIPQFKVASNEDKQKLWLAVATPRWKKFYGNEELEVDWQVLDELYTYKVESMLDWDAFFVTAKVIDVGLKEEFLKSCIKKYDSMKLSMGIMDFTDYLLLMIDALKKYPDLKKKIQERYRIIVADENQDFTALMNELLIQLYDPTMNQLIVVGDPDQTIYAFKGVSPDNVVSLVERLDDVTLLGLDTNYRCPDRIVDAAKKILEQNMLRFDKPIKTVRTGGKIIRHPVQAAFKQYDEVFNILNSIGVDGYKDTVITYRNNKSAIILGEELYYANIPFSVLDDHRPFNNLVFKQIMSALIALKEKDNMELNAGLYRFLPVSKDYWRQVLDANSKMRRSHLHDMVIPSNAPSGTQQAMSILIDISMRIDSAPCSDYIGALIQLYRKYYFDFLAKNPAASIGDTDMYLLWLERTVKFWSRPYSFDYMQKELQERNVDSPNAITLSTFHGLKGLEFKHVIAIDFNDSVFPNFFSIEQRYPKNTALEEKESENRLCYVLVTRAIETLHLVYLESDPSLYLEWIAPTNTEADKDGSVDQGIVLGSVSLPGDAASAKLKFIQRLTADRGR